MTVQTNVPIITHFEGHYRFLSNFFVHPFIYNGVGAPSAEHHYQAAKAVKPEERKRILLAESPGQAKRFGKSCLWVPEWDGKKVDVMREVLRAKFEVPFLKNLLQSTGDAILVEGNTWNDRFWGQCPVGNGQNMLGVLLMELRADHRRQQ